MSLGHGASVVRDGLVLHLDAANVKSYPGSGTTWKDLSGNGYDGTLTNGPLYQNETFVIDNTDDSIVSTSESAVALRSGIPGQRKITIDAFVNFFSDSVNWQALVGYGFCRYMSRRNTDNLILTMLTSNGLNTWPQSGIIPSDQFVHLVLVVEEDISATYYLNTNLSNQTLYTNLRFKEYSQLEIGSTSDLNHRLGGQLGSIRFYNRALTESEIKQNFEALRGRYGI